MFHLVQKNLYSNEVQINEKRKFIVKKTVNFLFAFKNVLNGSYSQAARNARTSYTSAQNSSRIDGLEEFVNAGIKVQKEWMVTRDERTRESHAQLNGVRVDVNEKFPNGLMYPADPDGEPAEVYNCRCKVVAYFPNHSKDRGTEKSVESYNKWLEEKNGYFLSNGHTSNTRLELQAEKVE